MIIIDYVTGGFGQDYVSICTMIRGIILHSLVLLTVIINTFGVIKYVVNDRNRSDSKNSPTQRLKLNDVLVNYDAINYFIEYSKEGIYLISYIIYKYTE